AVKTGDKVSQGSALLTLESAAPSPAAPRAGGSASESRTPASQPGSAGGRPGESESPAPQRSSSAARPSERAASSAAPHAGEAPGSKAMASSFSGRVDIECEMLVLGSGPGGYSAAFRAADLGMKTVLVERYATLGGVCLNVGCIPSKALLHTAAVMDEAKAMGEHGITYAAPKIELDKLRSFKNGVVKKLTGGLAGMAKARKVDIVRGIGRFLDPHHVEVDLTSGSDREATAAKKTIRFEKAIVAAVSEAVKLPFMPDDPRVVDSTGALELPSIPKRMLVVGGGIIGLEMANVYSSLGSRIDVVEMLDGVMMGADRDLVKVWEKKNAGRFDKLMLKTKTVSAE